MFYIAIQAESNSRYWDNGYSGRWVARAFSERIFAGTDLTRVTRFVAPIMSPLEPAAARHLLGENRFDLLRDNVTPGNRQVQLRFALL